MKTLWIKVLIFGKKNGSFGVQVFIAILLGICTGTFLGPLCLSLKPAAEIYTMLLQTVVLPYVCFSIIEGIGSLTPKEGRRIFTSSWFYFFGIWILAIFVILGASRLIPTPNATMITIPLSSHASDFSEKFLAFLVPQNPFYDLSNNVLPAISIFGLIMGTALMNIENKQPLLGILDRFNVVFEKIFSWLIVISPIGLFALIAVNIGTISWIQLSGLKFYVLVTIIISLFTSFILLPLVVSSLTSLSYKETRTAFLTVCLVPFASGLVTLTIPFLILYLRDRLELNRPISRTLIPIAYTGAQIGNCLIIFFVLFLSYYFSHPFRNGEEIFLSALSIPLTLGSASNSLNAISFLLQHLDLPKNSLALYDNALHLTCFFQSLMSSAAILTIALLTIYTYDKGDKRLRVHWTKLFRPFVPLTLAFLAIVLIKPLIHTEDYYPHLYKKLRIQDVIENPAQTIVYLKQPVDNARSNPEQQFLNILKTGVLKVGYHPLEVPYCYWNQEGELVGYDIAYAHQLAKDLDCKIEFIPLQFGHLKQELDEGLYDIAMSAIIMSEQRIINMTFTAPYDEQKFVLVVPIKERDHFLNLETVAEREGLKIGGTGVFSEVIERHFPLAEQIDVMLDEQIDYLKAGKIDAVIWERASAFIWSLSNPDFIVIDYDGLIGSGYFAYAYHNNSPKFSAFLNNWLMLKKISGFNEKMRNYWIEGILTK